MYMYVMYMYTLYIGIGNSDHTHHLIATIREIIVQYSEVLEVHKHLPHLPNPVNGHTFSQELVKYAAHKEWISYKENTVSI